MGKLCEYCGKDHSGGGPYGWLYPINCEPEAKTMEKMDIQEFSTLIEEALTIEWVPDLQWWRCSFQSGEVKNRSTQESKYGYGKDILEAVGDYTDKISGEILVFHAEEPKRKQQHVVPDLSRWAR